MLGCVGADVGCAKRPPDGFEGCPSVVPNRPVPLEAVVPAPGAEFAAAGLPKLKLEVPLVLAPEVTVVLPKMPPPLDAKSFDDGADPNNEGVALACEPAALPNMLAFDLSSVVELGSKIDFRFAAGSEEAGTDVSRFKLPNTLLLLAGLPKNDIFTVLAGAQTCLIVLALACVFYALSSTRLPTPFQVAGITNQSIALGRF